MIPADRDRFVDLLANTKLHGALGELLEMLDDKYANPKHGNFKDWQEIIESLPKITPSTLDFNQAAPVIGSQNDCTPAIQTSLKENLLALRPWRKGPFNVFGIHIDSEWRSDWKWSRLAAHIQLKDKLVLDVGCSNGYYALRMQALGAKLVLGVDSTWLYVFQFLALQKYLTDIQRIFVLPFALEGLPISLAGFGAVFSMGVLYHRQEPQTHLRRLHALLDADGQLILETLIIEDDDADVLIPNERYANIRNVWMLPSVGLLKVWLKDAGFENIRIIDTTKTTVAEQRQSEWMIGYSLANALDPDNSNLTIEGYPAPLRAMIIASKAS